ncbi:hypothetical protein BDQ17DRAFT_1352321 [Cyathus striatus]|nr:hypothetical protein BDQ17DRAFT_1352321 [Cyathus striatus]
MRVNHIQTHDSPLKNTITRFIVASDAKTKRELGRISGLLAPRQLECDPGFGVCSDNSGCCPLGGDCCSDGQCCDSGQFCAGSGHCCLDTQRSCEGGAGCCNSGETCCSDGSCCGVGTYCVLAPDGEIGCCPNGELCSGNPLPTTAQTIAPPPPPTTAPPTTRTATTIQTTVKTTETPTTSLTSIRTTSTVVFSTVSSSTLGSSDSGGSIVPPPPPPTGSRSVIITSEDVSITWQGEWVTGVSSCDPTVQSRTPRYWNGNPLPSNIYLNVATKNTYFGVFVNGVSNVIYSPNDSRLTNCTYGWSSSLTVGVTYNITVLVYGASLSSQQSGDSTGSSFEFNNFAIAEPLTASSAGTSPTGLTPSSAKAFENKSIALYGLTLVLAIYIFL